jgi:hypothetical protein
MKSFIILVLSILLAGGAWLSKPSERSFRAMVTKKLGQETIKSEGGDFNIVFGKKPDAAEKFLSECKFKDRVLWTTVEKDGKTIYTGAFATWFGSDLKIEKVAS